MTHNNRVFDFLIIMIIHKIWGFFFDKHDYILELGIFIFSDKHDYILDLGGFFFDNHDYILDLGIYFFDNHDYQF